MPEHASSSITVPVDLDDVEVLSLTGEIDAATASAARAKTLAAVDARPATLVLDLTGVDFLGSDGIGIVMETAQRAELRGIRFVVVADRRVVLRPLQVTGVAVRLTIRPDLAGALADLDSRVPAARSGGA